MQANIGPCAAAVNCNSSALPSHTASATYLLQRFVKKLCFRHLLKQPHRVPHSLAQQINMLPWQLHRQHEVSPMRHSSTKGSPPNLTYKKILTTSHGLQRKRFLRLRHESRFKLYSVRSTCPLTLLGGPCIKAFKPRCNQDATESMLARMQPRSAFQKATHCRGVGRPRQDSRRQKAHQP